MVVHSPSALVLPRAARDRCSPTVFYFIFNLENSIGQEAEVEGRGSGGWGFAVCCLGGWGTHAPSWVTLNPHPRGRDGGRGSQGQCPAPPAAREGSPPALSCQQRGLTFCLTFMFREKETAKLPMSEDSFQPPKMGVGNPGQSSRRPPPCRASAPVYTSHPLPPIRLRKADPRETALLFLHTPPAPLAPLHLPPRLL